MPELPDVELFKRVLDRAALGRTIGRVTVRDARILAGVSPRELAARLEGTRLTSSRRHGKHLLAGLDGGGWLTLHFGMTGALVPFGAVEDEPPYERVRLDFTDGRHLAYTSVRMLGRVGLAEDADAFIEAEGLGPDALDPRFDLAAFTAALGGRKRSVKSALMDQAAMSGVGNIYSDEILFQARLHPGAPVDRLDAAQAHALFGTVKEVLRTAVKRGAGSEHFLDRLPAGYLLPQRKKGGRCPRCGAEIRTLKVSGRTGYYCPGCQGGGAR
jgi:formamidopyrimidine-DNA glycosylase